MLTCINRVLALLLLFFSSLASAIDLEKHPGKLVYQQQCADCHGAKGEGNAEEEIEPLIGRRTLESLAGRIERTMPEDDEEACVGENAKAVAEYIYHAFYSPEAQAKNRGFRKTFSRLTVNQYQNSLIDTFGHFRNSRWNTYSGEPGLTANYALKARSANKNRKANHLRTIKRIDKNIAFNYGKELPSLSKEIAAAEKKEAEAKKKKQQKKDDKEPQKTEARKPVVSKQEFNIEWKGGIYARHTGVYEFFFRTRNGGYLNINEPDDKRGKLIDAWVAPNNDIRELSAKIYLVGGRTYPLELSFFKYKEDQALIELLWKPPHGVKEVVPPEVLSTGYRPRVFVPSVRFPADDRSLGYETGNSISRAWMDAISEAGLEAANHAAEHLSEFAQIRKEDDAATELKKIKSFAGNFAEIALRKNLSPAEKSALIGDLFDQPKVTKEQAIQRFVLRILTSPEFLYPASQSNEESWQNGAALASAMWDSLPGKLLRSSAEKKQLDTEPRLENWAKRMLDDTRTKHKMDGFFHHWLELEKTHDIAKDKKLYPAFNKEIISDLNRSLELFLDDVVWSDRSDYRQLLLDNTIFANARIAKLYGLDKQPSQFQKVVFKNENRSGIITHPLLLTAQAYHNNSSPIHRGVFLSKNIVGLPLKPPKEAIVFDDNQFDPSLTMREKVTKLTESSTCMACHASINPLGFSLEHFDAIGRWRKKEAGKLIHDDAALKLDSGEVHKFNNARDLAVFAAESSTAHKAFIRHLFHHMVKQPMETYGLNTGQELYEDFKKNGFSIKHLMVKIAVISATRGPEKS